MVTILRKNKVTQCEVYVRVNGASAVSPLQSAAPALRDHGGGWELCLLIWRNQACTKSRGGWVVVFNSSSLKLTLGARPRRGEPGVAGCRWLGSLGQRDTEKQAASVSVTSEGWPGELPPGEAEAGHQATGDISQCSHSPPVWLPGLVAACQCRD